MSNNNSGYENEIIDQSSEESLKESVGKLVSRIRPEWTGRLDKLQVKQLSGGVTNKLYSCFLKERGLDTKDTVLLRIYGAGTEMFISREDEITTMNLVSRIGLGPQFYLKFAHGICYEYLPGVITDQQLLNDENVYPKVAEAVANLHLLNFKGARTERELDPNTEQIFIFNKIRQLIDLLKEDFKTTMDKMTDEYLSKTPSLNAIRTELNSLQTAIKAYTEKHNSLVVFSHNDLLMGNIIYNPNDKTVKFIDYEYGGLNYQAYDIANHFNEFAGVEEPDYSFFPDEAYQFKWVKIYLDSFYSKVNRYFIRQSNDELTTVDDSLVKQFCHEVNLFTLASHFMWAVWSLVQAQNSHLDFDFVKYANIRFDQYFKHKPKYFS